MGDISTPDNVLVFAGIMVKKEMDITEVMENFTDFGRIMGMFGPVEFSRISNYYDEEMGGKVQKYYLFTDKLISPEKITGLKILSNSVEEELSDKGGRTVNFDVGYIGLSKFVLASTKNFSHRIYLGKGIYAEITMLFKNGDFSSLEWTYDDYKNPKVIEILKGGRDYLKKVLREENEKKG